MRILNRKHVLSFDGGHVDLGMDPAFDLEEALTIAAWVRPATGDKLQATILSKNAAVYEPQVQNGRFVFERGTEYNSTGTVAMSSHERPARMVKKAASRPRKAKTLETVLVSSNPGPASGVKRRMKRATHQQPQPRLARVMDSIQARCRLLA